MREYMRAAIEEHEAVQEELRSAHEEMLSANEEFQSTNEELETSKEELQSTNEELTTTIDELRSRNQELARAEHGTGRCARASDAARSYADTIIQSVREPLAVLDGTLRILRVNSAFAANLAIPREEIEGRFLHEVGDGRWNIPELHQRLRAVAGQRPATGRLGSYPGRFFTAAPGDVAEREEESPARLSGPNSCCSRSKTSPRART